MTYANSLPGDGACFVGYGGDQHAATRIFVIPAQAGIQ